MTANVHDQNHYKRELQKLELSYMAQSITAKTQNFGFIYFMTDLGLSDLIL